MQRGAKHQLLVEPGLLEEHLWSLVIGSPHLGQFGRGGKELCVMPMVK
jgi:hypothetical protein